MRIGVIGGSNKAQSNALGAEQTRNCYQETNETAGVVGSQAYGGRTANKVTSFIGTPGKVIHCALPTGPTRGGFQQNGRCFEVADTRLYEIFADGTYTDLGFIASGGAVSICANSIQMLIVGGGRAYCFEFAANTLTDVTAQLVGVPIQCDCSDTYGIVIFQNSNKIQYSSVLDFSTWVAGFVDEVSVFPDNLVSIIVNHRELWVFGSKRSQPYQDTGSTNVFDVISGALIETGSAATFSVQRVDNSVFWVGQDERGALVVWRSNGYTPARISDHSVEVWLAGQANASQLVAHSYQQNGHLFYVLYVPGSDCNYVYDVGESAWHQRDAWLEDTAVSESDWAWNHVYAFGKHLVGDWKTGNLYALSLDAFTDNGNPIRRLRRTPTLSNEKEWIYVKQLTLDLETGLAPQPPLTDGDGNDRQPQIMLRWSDDFCHTWSNIHTADCGFAGEYSTRVVFRRLGRTRNRNFEISFTDPVKFMLVDGYAEIS